MYVENRYAYQTAQIKTNGDNFYNCDMDWTEEFNFPEKKHDHKA